MKENATGGKTFIKRAEFIERFVEKLVNSDDWVALKGAINKNFTKDIKDLSGENPGLQSSIRKCIRKSIEGEKLEVEEYEIKDWAVNIAKEMQGVYALCLNDFTAKHNVGNKATSKNIKTAVTKAGSTSVAVAKMAADGGLSAAAMMTAGAGGVLGGGLLEGVGMVSGAVLGNVVGVPGIIEDIGVEVGKLGEGAINSGADAAKETMLTFEASQSAAKLLFEIGAVIYECLEQSAEKDEEVQGIISKTGRFFGINNKEKYPDILDTPGKSGRTKMFREKCHTECGSRILVEEEVFTAEELKQTLYNHFDNKEDKGNFNNNLEVADLAISSSIKDKNLMKTILQYQMVKHFGKLSDDEKDFYFDINKTTPKNIKAFKEDLKNAHDHIEDYAVFHKAMMQVRKQVVVTPRMQNKLANILIPALINNECESDHLEVRLADRLLENKSIFRRELTVKKSELREIAADIVRGDLNFAPLRGYIR